MNESVEITRYPNRRLYDRSQKKYVTLGDIESLVLGGQNVRVRDSKTEEDLTRVILMQILLERHPERMQMFSVTFLQEVLRADQRALDWLAVYFGNAKLWMEGVATGANMFPGMDIWQSMLAGVSKGSPPAASAPTATAAPSTPTSEPSAAAKGPPAADAEWATKLSELEKRLAQLEGGGK